LLGSVHEHLDRRRRVAKKLFAEAGRDHEYEAGVTGDEQVAVVFFGRGEHRDLEIPGGTHRTDVLTALIGVVVVADRHGDVADVGRRGVSQHEKLDDRRDDENPKQALVAPDLRQLFFQQDFDAVQVHLKSTSSCCARPAGCTSGPARAWPQAAVR
jgi:hypothetical protein